MALSIEIIRRAVRADADTDTDAELTRLQGVAVAYVAKVPKLSGIPEAVVDEAALRLIAYLYDRPAAATGTSYAAAFRNSGAAEALGPWILRRAIKK